MLEFLSSFAFDLSIEDLCFGVDSVDRSHTILIFLTSYMFLTSILVKICHTRREEMATFCVITSSVSNKIKK